MYPCSARGVQSGSVMNASAREVVELASTDYELSDVSDRRTDIPVLPMVTPLDLDTTQVVPKLVLSELRYQARVRTNPEVAALAANDDAVGVADALALADSAPVASASVESAPITLVQASIEAVEVRRQSGMRGAIAAGVAIGLAGIALVGGVVALVY